jgi:hypothetical protein
MDFDVTADVTAMAGGGAYHGWLLKKTEEGQSGLVEYTSRQGASGQGPRIEVVLEPGQQAGSPKVVIEHPVEGSFTNQETLEVRGAVTGGGPIATVLVNGQPATLAGQTFSITLQLEEGFNTVLVVATDTFGNRGVAGVGLSLDTEPPQVVLSAPVPGQLVNGDSIRVSGEALDSTAIERVTVDGLSVPVVDNLFTTEIELLQEGPRTITVEASDLAGNSVAISREVIRFSLPEATIATPADLAIVAATTLSVGGTVSDDVVAVAVNGVSASLTPPRVTIIRPLNGSRTREGMISVSGLVNDIVPGTVNSTEATVTINGIPAEVVNRSFLVAAVPLAPGRRWSSG